MSVPVNLLRAIVILKSLIRGSSAYYMEYTFSIPLPPGWVEYQGIGQRDSEKISQYIHRWKTPQETHRKALLGLAPGIYLSSNIIS